MYVRSKLRLFRLSKGQSVTVNTCVWPEGDEATAWPQVCSSGLSLWLPSGGRSASFVQSEWCCRCPEFAWRPGGCPPDPTWMIPALPAPLRSRRPTLRSGDLPMSRLMPVRPASSDRRPKPAHEPSWLVCPPNRCAWSGRQARCRRPGSGHPGSVDGGTPAGH